MAWDYIYPTPTVQPLRTPGDDDLPTDEPVRIGDLPARTQSERHLRSRVHYMANKTFDQAFGFAYLHHGIRKTYTMSDFKYDIKSGYLVMGKATTKTRISTEEHQDIQTALLCTLDEMHSAMQAQVGTEPIGRKAATGSELHF